MTYNTGLSALAAAAFGFAALAQPAPANAAYRGIVCDGQYQVIKGQLIQTPYCMDANLAKVANSYGMRVSAEAVRSSPAVKASACRLVGYDNRVQSACINYRNQSRNTPY